VIVVARGNESREARANEAPAGGGGTTPNGTEPSSPTRAKPGAASAGALRLPRATKSRVHMKMGIPWACARYAYRRLVKQYRWRLGLMPPHHKIGIELFAGVGVAKRGAFQGFYPAASFEHNRMSGASIPQTGGAQAWVGIGETFGNDAQL